MPPSSGRNPVPPEQSGGGADGTAETQYRLHLQQQAQQIQLLQHQQAQQRIPQHQQQHQQQSRGAQVTGPIMMGGRNNNMVQIRGGTMQQQEDGDDESAGSAARRVGGGQGGLPTTTPLFERLVTEEVQELKTYARLIESQNRRLVDLERTHGDLEHRLERESQNRQQLEATLEAREREWSRRLEQLEKDRQHWKEVVQAEQAKNIRLVEQVVRKDQDIHRMLQRKYDHEGGQRPIRGKRGDKQSRSPDLDRSKANQGPHEILVASGSVEKVRRRNANSLLLDFFGM